MSRVKSEKIPSFLALERAKYPLDPVDDASVSSSPTPTCGMGMVQDQISPRLDAGGL